MKKQFFASTFLFIALLVQGHAFGVKLSGDVNMPVMGEILSQTGDERALKYVVTSDSTKAHSPIEGSVYYVGPLDDYGFSVVIKNAHRVAVIGNLDRAYVVKNQYLLQNDSVGSVVYHSKVVFIVQQVQRTPSNYHPDDQSDGNSSIDIAKKFQDKLFAFAKSGTNFLHHSVLQTLSYTYITNLLKDTGFPEKSIPTMYCIAKWESGLNPKALNFNSNNTVDVGLFQINSTWFKKCGANLATLYDEKENTECALTVFKNQGLSAWTTYNKNKNAGSTDYCLD